ncbi:MAG TPA: amino acid ABC transporter permease [Anaeromyxobacteraceae bacterium]
MGYHWRWSVFLDPVPSGGGTYLGWMIAGLETTVALSLTSWFIALVIGSVMGVLRTVPNRLLYGIATVYVEVFRNVPLLVQLFLWYFVAPELLPTAIGNAVKQTHPFTQQFLAAMVCLGLFTGARVCEQVRAGINSLSRGQKSAALALGFTLPQTYRHVLMPMAFRLIVPPLTSELLNIFKNSAVASTIGLLELAAEGRQLVDYTAQPYESFIAVTLTYAAINVVLMGVMRVVEGRARVPGFIGGR